MHIKASSLSATHMKSDDASTAEPVVNAQRPTVRMQRWQMQLRNILLE